MKNTKIFIIFIMALGALFYNISIFAQNEDIYDSNNYNPDVANGNIVIDDTQIASDVKQALKPELSAKNIHIKISSLEGVVQFTGHVDTSAEASKLVKTAESVRGVRGVDASELTVQGF